MENKSPIKSSKIILYPYRKNGLTCPWSIQQYLGIFITLFSTIIYYIFLQDKLPYNILFICFVTFSTVCLLLLGFYLAYFDPTDETKEFSDNLLYCEICKKHVQPTTIHCRYCNKCIERLDHHCFFINNCIGKRNYKLFITLLVIGFSHYTLLTTLEIYIAVNTRDSISIVFSTISLFSSLFFLHLIYLHIKLYTLKMTTLEYSRYLNSSPKTWRNYLPRFFFTKKKVRINPDIVI